MRLSINNFLDIFKAGNVQRFLDIVFISKYEEWYFLFWVEFLAFPNHFLLAVICLHIGRMVKEPLHQSSEQPEIIDPEELARLNKDIVFLNGIIAQLKVHCSVV